MAVNNGQAALIVAREVWKVNYCRARGLTGAGLVESLLFFFFPHLNYDFSC